MEFLRKKVFLWILKFLNLKDSTTSEKITQDSENSTTIQILPNEMLGKVFEHLSLKDLIKCYETSQKWREVAKLQIYYRLKKPDSLQVVSNHDFESLEVFSTLNENRHGGILICMPNGMYIFGGFEFSQNPFHYGPLTSKFLENGSKVWTSGPIFPHKMYPRPRSIHDFVRDHNTFEFSAGHKISTNEFIVVVNRHVFKYDIENQNWSYFVKSKHSRRYSCSIVFDGKLIIAGGVEFPHGNVLQTTEIVDLSSRKTWIGGDNYVQRAGFKLDICLMDKKPRIVAYYGNYHTEFIEIWNEESQSWKVREVSSNFSTKMRGYLTWLERNKGLHRLDKILIFQNFHIYCNRIANFIPLNAFHIDRKKALKVVRSRRYSFHQSDSEFEAATRHICREYYWDFEFEV